MLKLLKRILLTLFVLIAIVCSYEIYKGYEMYEAAITAMSVKEMAKSIQEKENYTLISEMPEVYKNAVVAVEDHRFYKHNGIDIISIGRAIVSDIKAGEFVAGGSTITQQLAKNTYFTQEKKIERKIAEVFMAFEIEDELSKKEILELYLNTSYFGEGCYTVSEASDFYFDKEPSMMDDYESTLLAGIPNAPSVYAPTKNPDLAKQRQRQVLDKMIEHDKISREEANEILKIDYEGAN